MINLSTLIIYFLAISLVILSSLWVCTYCIIKIVKVSNGVSLLDLDVISSSLGLQARKWFLISIGILSGARCASSLMECFLVVKFILDGIINKEITNFDYESISFYQGIKTSTVYFLFVVRMFPVFIYTACYFMLGLFLFHLYFTMSGNNFLILKILWILFNLVSLVVIAQFLLVAPDIIVLTGVLILIFVLYSISVLFCLYNVHIYYSSSLNHNQTTPLVSYNQSSHSHSNLNSSKKVINRFFYLIVLSLSSILMHVFVYIVDLLYIFKERSFFFQSTVDLSSIWLSECLLPYLSVSLLSNQMTSIEAILSRRGNHNSSNNAITATNSSSNNNIWGNNSLNTRQLQPASSLHQSSHLHSTTTTSVIQQTNPPTHSQPPPPYSNSNRPYVFNNAKTNTINYQSITTTTI